MPLVTTPRGLVTMFRAKLGVAARPPRKLVRDFKRRQKTAAYRTHERATVAAARLSETERT